ncbi:MAG TPA: hypothetical protein VLE69_00260 [Candidatus Saccharimonadales bacterium]|nr:hypothetical protein [Candidatus Saccharimonadales bacterium]
MNNEITKNPQEKKSLKDRVLKSKLARALGTGAAAASVSVLAVAAPAAATETHDATAPIEATTASTNPNSVSTPTEGTPASDQTPTSETDVPVSIPPGETVTPIDPTDTDNTTTTLVIDPGKPKPKNPTTTTYGGGAGGPPAYVDPGNGNKTPNTVKVSPGWDTSVPGAVRVGSDGTVELGPATHVLAHTGSGDGLPVPLAPLGGAVVAGGLIAGEIARHKGHPQDIIVGTEAQNQ